MGDKRIFLSLPHLDSFLLSGILCYLDGYDLANLWFVGDRKLQYLMSEGGAVLTFSTNFETDTKLLRESFPMMLKHFSGLKHLELTTVRQKSSSIYFVDLPASLKSLSIENIDASCLVASLQMMTTSFPRLTSLKVYKSAFRWSKKHLALLPDTLETLLLRVVKKATSLSKLPPNVTSVDVRVLDYTDLSQIFLPEHLLELTLDCRDGRGKFPKPPLSLHRFMTHLPRCLLQLRLYFIDLIYDCFLDLPPSLTELCLSLVSVPEATQLEQLHSLPELTHLKIDFSGGIPANVVSSLSSRLKVIELNSLDEQPLEWPPNATRCNAYAPWSSLGYPLLTLIQKLPRGLVELTISLQPVFTSETVDAIPKTLETLRCNYLAPNWVPFLPPRLKHLFIRSNSFANVWTPSELALLPSSLVSFKAGDAIQCTKNDDLKWVGRCANLESLSIQCHLSPTVLSHLPTSLTKLRLRDLSKAEYETWQWKAVKQHCINLQSVSIHGSRIDPDVLYCFHNKLRQLELNNIGKAKPLSDEHIRSSSCLALLTSISILGCTKCTDACLPTLPQYLSEETKSNFPDPGNFTASALQSNSKASNKISFVKPH